MTKINWIYLCYKTNPIIIKLLEQNIDKINWNAISSNSNAVELLAKNMDKIDWDNMMINENMNILYIFEKNMNKIKSNIFSNPNIFIKCISNVNLEIV